jgi:hypothetical protein
MQDQFKVPRELDQTKEDTWQPEIGRRAPEKKDGVTFFT